MNLNEQKFLNKISSHQKHLYHLRWLIPLLLLAFCALWAYLCWRITVKFGVNIYSVFDKISVEEQYHGYYIRARDAAIKSTIYFIFAVVFFIALFTQHKNTSKLLSLINNDANKT